MNSGIKKRVCIFSAAAILSISMVRAAVFDNNIVDIQFTESGDQVTAVVLTEKGYSEPLKAVKAGGYYNIIMPNIGKGKKSSYTPNVNNVDIVRVTTLSSSTGGGSYTKIAIKTKPGISVNASSKVYEDIDFQDAADEWNERPRVEQPVEEEPEHEANVSEEEEYIEEEYSEESEGDMEEPVAESQPEQLPQETSILEQERVSSKPLHIAPEHHTSEILYILIGSAAVLLVVVLLYIKGKDRMNALCGDMNITLDDKKEKKQGKNKKAKPEKTEKKKPKQQTPQGLIDLDYSYNAGKVHEDAAATAQTGNDEPDEPEKTVIDLDEIYSGPIAATSETSPTSVAVQVVPPVVEEFPQEEDEDIDDFLESFVDEDYEVESTTDGESGDVYNEPEKQEVPFETVSGDGEKVEEAPTVNPVDNLIDDVIATQSMSFTDSDIDAIRAKLQADLTPDILEQTKNKLDVTVPIPHLTVEEFDKKYPMLGEDVINSIINNPNIKFNDIDLNVIFSPITSYEMSEDAILEAQLRKDKEDEANIQYYENEQDFAFTLIKTQDVQNPEELVVLDDNVYPDLANVDFSNDEIFKEFSFAKPDYPEPHEEEAPTEEDIDNAIAHEMEIINQQKAAETQQNNDDSILSEFKLIKPEVKAEKSDELFSTTIFTSMEDIESQFKALGLDFKAKEKEAADNKEESLDTLETKVAEADNIADYTKIYASCQMDFSTELYITTYNDKIALVGMKNGVIKHLHDFEDGKIPSKLSARKAEETESGDARYIVRADKEKFVIDVSDNDIKLVLIL